MSRQFVVQVTNQPGQKARLAEEMAAAGVDLRAIGGGGLGEVGHFIMTTADDDAARKVLEAGGWTFLEGESLLAEVDDRPGGMARIARELRGRRGERPGPPVPGRWSDRRPRVRCRRPEGPSDPRATLGRTARRERSEVVPAPQPTGCDGSGAGAPLRPWVSGGTVMGHPDPAPRRLATSDREFCPCDVPSPSPSP
jgi:hypothetical protein